MNSRAAANRMRKEYGENCCEACFACCNRQWNNREERKMVCIAFDADVSWDGSERACGLFNVPFRGIRPVRRPLNDFLRKNTRAYHKTLSCENQNSFFAPLD